MPPSQALGPRSRRGLGTVAMLLLVAGLGLAPAAAHAAGAADFSLQLSSGSPNSPTGLTLHLRLRDASDPSAKPPALQSAIVKGPDGLRFDTAAVPRCNASDAEIQVLGADACSRDSELTVGSFSAMSGFGSPLDPIGGDDHVFNGPEELVEIITAPGTPISPAADHLRISGSTLTAHPPTFPGGPPDGKMAVRSIDFKIPVLGSHGRSLITTPSACPAAGQWTTTATFFFQDGSTATASSATPCRPQPASDPRSSRVAGRPMCTTARRSARRVPRRPGRCHRRRA